MKKYYAHSGNAYNKWHLLKEHLTSVSRLCGEYLSGWKNADGEELSGEGELAGGNHDIGKYGDLFDERLHGNGSGLDHWSQGAFLALTKFGSIAAAMAIQGHHIGLQTMTRDGLEKLNIDYLDKNHPLSLALSEKDISILEERLLNDGVVIKKPCAVILKSLIVDEDTKVDKMLDVRRVFSALVDADFVDTEAHFNGDVNGNKVYRKKGLKLNENNLAGRSLEKLKNHIYKKSKQHNKSDTLNDIRQELLQNCIDKSQNDKGLFTLTAPTGSGKTLSMLRFALEHAIKHNLERIIIVIPYLSIIEQTAEIYQDIFDADLILEHHSMSDLGVEKSKTDSDGNDYSELQTKRQRLLSENWDAPIVITTNVQFLESIFSNRPSSCRKIHRIANSVILFDEVQSLPISLAIPSLSAVSHIATNWNSSVVFATATQPAFNDLNGEIIKHCTNEWKPTEVVSNSSDMMERLRRVNITWIEEKLTWQALADKLRQHDQVLCRGVAICFSLFWASKPNQAANYATVYVPTASAILLQYRPVHNRVD